MAPARQETTPAALLAQRMAERPEALAAAIPGAELVVVPDSGHALVVEAPERLTAVLMEFLARIGQKGAFS